MYRGYKLAIVVPAYNEEGLIAETLKGMPPDADRIYVIDDGSTDGTHQIIESFRDERLCFFRNGHNRGVGAAIIAGYKKALAEGMDIAVVMAGDNQMDRKYLPELLTPLVEGKADYAKGSRLTKAEHYRGMSKWRLFGNWVLTLLTKVATGCWKIRDPQNGYTAISSGALKRIDLDQVYTYYGYCNHLLVELNIAGCRIVDVPIPARYGKEKSKIQYQKYITRISVLLLRIFLFRLWTKYFKLRKAVNTD
jgi:glycosyltransferase involved in cell wall biosynthesis